MIRKTLVMAYAGLAYLVGTASLVALVVFLSGWLPALSVDYGVARPIGEALLINGALMGLWTLQHIGMARRGFKRWLRTWMPDALERSTYVLFTGLALGVVLVSWSPIPKPAFEVTRTLAVTGIYAVFLAGWAFALAGILYDSYLEFVGLKQAYCHVRGLPFETAPFKTGFVFRLCRRPSFFGILVGCWATPVMTAGHVLFAVGMTAFTLVGCYFVERTYVQHYGAAYREFQSVTPLFFPRVSALWNSNHTPREPT